MTCQDVQSSLSLYLYGELDFAQEEEVENHLADCAACQLSLAREKPEIFQNDPNNQPKAGKKNSN